LKETVWESFQTR